MRYGPRGMFLDPTLEQEIQRLKYAVVAIATELEMKNEKPRPSIEEIVEKILYPEHF